MSSVCTRQAVRRRYEFLWTLCLIWKICGSCSVPLPGFPSQDISKSDNMRLNLREAFGSKSYLFVNIMCSWTALGPLFWTLVDGDIMSWTGNNTKRYPEEASG